MHVAEHCRGRIYANKGLQKPVQVSLESTAANKAVHFQTAPPQDWVKSSSTCEFCDECLVPVEEPWSITMTFVETS